MMCKKTMSEETGLNVLNPIPAWRQEFEGYTPHAFQKDLFAGLTVGVVALPLALAFGVSSGAGAAAGLFTAIVAGFVASLFGGSRYQISGPTGAMTVVLLPIIAQYGLGKVFVVGLMAGGILLLLGLLKMGRFVALMPWPVVTGFTTGIALVIFLQQVPGFLGFAPSMGESILGSTWATIGSYARAPQVVTVALAFATIGIKLLWQRVSKRVPGSIVALLVITVASLVLPIQVPRIGEIPAFLPVPAWPSLAFSDLTNLFPAALAVALLAGIESLLSAVVADGMTVKEHHDSDRELIGQGFANLIAPLFGGIPATGAIARTAIGLRAGGQTRLVGILHSLFLLLTILALGRYAALIPLAALSGILMVTAYRMIEFDSIKALSQSSRREFLTMLLTCTVTVGFNLILAIEVGLVTAGILFIHRMSQSLTLEPIDVALPASLPSGHEPPLSERVLAYRVEGPLFFGVASSFLESLSEISNVDVLILRLRRVNVLDASAAHALEMIHDDLARHGVTLLLSGLQPQPQELLQKMGLVDDLTDGGSHLFDHTDAAIEHALRHLKTTHMPCKAA